MSEEHPWLRAVRGEPVCWELMGFCRCGRETGHDGRHVCNGCDVTWANKGQKTQKGGQE